MQNDSIENTLSQQLSELIKADGNKEHECREYLQHVKELLVHGVVMNYVYLETERRGHAGDSDYIISSRVLDEGGFETVRAYIWELKAPQCDIFEADTKNRLRPSRDLISAENQLLYYYDELRGSDQARHEFGVTHPRDVCFGGIIIGCRRTWVRGDFDEDKTETLFERAVMLRKEFIYNPSGIRLMTWDYILDQLKQYESSDGKIA